MDSVENTQEVNDTFARTKEGSAEEAANEILNMWNSEEQPTNEEAEATVDEEVVEETEEAEETEEEAPEGQAEEEVEESEEETSEEEEESDEEFEVVNEDDLKYTVKVDGEELEVSIEELRNLSLIHI